MTLLPPAGLLFFDSRPLVHQRHLALPQKGCRGHRVALGQPLRSRSTGCGGNRIECGFEGVDVVVDINEVLCRNRRLGWLLRDDEVG
jgi:hypothetical protein